MSVELSTASGHFKSSLNPVCVSPSSLPPKHPHTNPLLRREMWPAFGKIDEEGNYGIEGRRTLTQRTGTLIPKERWILFKITYILFIIKVCVGRSAMDIIIHYKFALKKYKFPLPLLRLFLWNYRHTHREICLLKWQVDEMKIYAWWCCWSS